MTLEALLTAAIDHRLLTPTRIAPMRTAVKQYAAMLDSVPAHCLPATYHLPEPQLAVLIDAKVSPQRSAYTVRNLKDNLRWLLRVGREHGWLAPLPPPLLSWRGRKKLAKNAFVPRHEGVDYSQYGLYPLVDKAPQLSQELEAYLAWCQGLSVRGERPPRAIRKREITCRGVRHSIEQIAGFAIKALGCLAVPCVCLPPEGAWRCRSQASAAPAVRPQGCRAQALTLHDLTDPALLDALAAWWVRERQKRVTYGLTQKFADIKTIVKYWEKDPERVAAITKILRELDPVETVRDKQARWLSLPELTAVAKSAYPLNARRMQESRYIRAVARHLADPAWVPIPKKIRTLKKTAWFVQVSLLLTLMIEWPWRQRNYREMLLGRHLTCQDGRWVMCFRGKDLKIARRGGQENQLTGVLSLEAGQLMQEWLDVWRPRLAPAGERHVFVNLHGKPMAIFTMTQTIKYITYRLTGVAVTPHLIRDIWASSYLADTGDIMGAAHRLGDAPETVLTHYAHILNARANARANTWLRGHLAGHPQGELALPPPAPAASLFRDARSTRVGHGTRRSGVP